MSKFQFEARLTCEECFSGGNIIAVGYNRAPLTYIRSRYPLCNIRRYILYGHGGNTVRAWTGHRSIPPVTVTRKGKGGNIQVISYGHGVNNVRA